MQLMKAESPTALQTQSGTIASSFEAGSFNPWLTNRHVQTIGGFFLRETCAFLPNVNTLPYFVSAALRAKDFKTTRGFWDSRERIETPDGDWFHADTKRVADKEAPMVVLCHGLASSSESPVSIEMAKAYNSMGMHCVCLNFRGCTDVPNDTLGGYHLGFTDDLKLYLSLMTGNRSSSMENRLYLSGFSLGANVVLKCLGELGEDALEKFNIHGAAVVCAPIEQTRNAEILASEPIYTQNLLRSLKQRARAQLDIYCNGDENTEKFDYKRGIGASTVTEFDDAFIAPIYGFTDAWDYYEKTSSLHFLEKISVPTLVLNSKDDPFMHPDVWPVEKAVKNGGSSPVQFVRTAHGGHLGYSFHLVDPDDERLLAGTPSWASSELARFLQHVHTHSETKDLKRSG
jgi:uncharacterized protein